MLESIKLSKNMLERILITLSCFLLATITFFLIFHYTEVQFRAQSMEIIFVIYFVVLIASLIILPQNFLSKDINYSKVLNITTFVNAIVLYLLLFFVYANIYFVADRSISIRTMIELDRKPQIGMTKKELYQYYNGDMIMERRLDHLVYGKFVRLDNDKYINTKTGTICAKVFNFLKKFLNLSQGG